ncbi:hypothetical protein GCM10007416_32450 [Kroppenstedtia guangzhouensis]|uniref:Uncharacterized protein n=1 Tax=Kroppenstedtia guangzhouensis TaxID=1274356 RepID=A0ABQ1H2N3_9BACL|nr:hypothetical protein GCM10007416_32450 [Kroppenstedtia guangzhouensis]
MKLCPDCKVPVDFVPDSGVVGGLDRSYYHCRGCHEKYDPSFPGFIVKDNRSRFPIRVQCTGFRNLLRGE